MASQTTEPFRVNERATAKLTATIQDEAGAAAAASALTTLTLTLFDLASGSVINSRDAQNVLNLNNVTVSEAGALIWSMLAADNAIIGKPLADGIEEHRAMFRWTWDSGAKAGVQEVRIHVIQLTKVT